MRILVLSREGDGLGFAQALAREGHDVNVWIADRRARRAGVGIVGRPAAWRPLLPQTDLIVCDMVGFGHLRRLFDKMGKPVISCHPDSDRAELDRQFGLALMRLAGIPHPRTWTFSRPSEARAVPFPPKGLVIKPSGNKSTALTTVNRTRDQYLWNLERLPADQPLIVQERVDGIEISTEGWFNGHDWVRPFNHTFEEKRLMDGGVGPNTGCMGNVVLAADENRIVRETVLKLTPFLRKISYRGPVDVNSIVNTQGVFALEFTMRPGYDAIEALTELLREPLGTLLFEVATGVKREMDLPSDEYGIAVRVSVPPWPHARPSAEQAGMPLRFPREAGKHVYLTDAYLEDGQPRYAAFDGVVAKVTARGRSPSEARGRVYRTLTNMRIPDAQYRTDIGQRVHSNLTLLRSMGYL